MCTACMGFGVQRMYGHKAGLETIIFYILKYIYYMRFISCFALPDIIIALKKEFSLPWSLATKCFYTSIASQPYFYSCACALGRGAGDRKEKYVWSLTPGFRFP